MKRFLAAFTAFLAPCAQAEGLDDLAWMAPCISRSPTAYWRDGEALVARIEGAINGQPRSRQWRFERMK